MCVKRCETSTFAASLRQHPYLKPSATLTSRRARNYQYTYWYIEVTVSCNLFLCSYCTKSSATIFDIINTNEVPTILIIKPRANSNCFSVVDQLSQFIRAWQVPTLYMNRIVCYVGHWSKTSQSSEWLLCIWNASVFQRGSKWPLIQLLYLIWL